MEFENAELVSNDQLGSVAFPLVYGDGLLDLAA